MSLTLEMPSSDLDLFSSQAPPESESATAAAELLDSAEPEVGEVDPPTDLEGQLDEAFKAADQQAASELPANGKAKRGRKKKQAEQAAEQADAGSDQPAGTQGSESVSAAAESQDARPAAAPADPVETIKVTATFTRTPQASDLLDEIAHAETKCAASERSVLLLKEELKEAKKEYDADVQALRKLCRALENDKARPLFDPCQKQSEIKVAAAADLDCRRDKPLDTNHPTNEAEDAAPKHDANAWRKVSIGVLGLSPKLEEKLCDGYPAMTLGTLEDLRAEISQGRAKWPKGIGQARITDIEDAIVAWLTENRDKATFAELGDGKVEQQADAGDVADASGYPTTDQWEAMSDASQAFYFEMRSKVLSDGATDCLARKHPETDRFYETGFRDCGGEIVENEGRSQRRLELRDCIYLPGPECDDWIRGFLAAKNVNEYEPENPQPATEQPTTTKSGVSLDDI